MAVTKRHSFDSGQTTGTAITTGNSGVGGDAFDTVTAGTGASMTYDSTASRGTLSGRCVVGGTTAAASTTWTSTSIGSVARSQGRMVVRADTFAASSMVAYRARSAGTQSFRVAISPTGHVEFRNTASSILGTSTVVMTAGVTWLLVRWDVTVGASSTGVMYITYDPTTAVFDETFSVSNANFFTGNIDEANYGIAATITSAAIRMDDIVYTDQGVPGPPQQSITVSDTTTISDAVTRAVVLPRAAADTTTISDAVTRSLLLPRAAANTTTISDSVVRALSLPRTAADTTTVGDATTRQLAQARTAADTTTFADAMTRALAQARAVADTTAIGDATGRALAMNRAAADTTAVSDTTARSLTQGRAAADTTTVADSANRSVALARTDASILTLVDSTGRVLLLGRAISDTLGIADSIVVESSSGTPVASGRLASAATGPSLASTASGPSLVTVSSAGRLVSTG